MNENRTPDVKESGRFGKIFGWTVSALFTALLCLPVVLLLTTGEDKTVLDGEKQYTPPAFTASEFVSSEFQSKFELWFSTKYPMRGKFVSTYRQIGYDLSKIGFDISTVFVPKNPPKPADDPKPDGVDTLEGGETGEVVEEVFTYSDFNPLYAEINRRLYEREEVENTGYKGAAQVVIGDSGYCYEDGYINEFYGYSQKYRDCPDEWIEDRVERLDYIQKELARRGIACTFVISASKASEYERFIPGWYMAQNTMPEDYTRPVDKLRKALADTDINYIDSARYFDEIGLDETFAVTGTHWNKPAAFEVMKRLLEMYTEQTGEQTVTIYADRIAESKSPSGYGNPENDIFNIAYSGIPTDDAIVDEYYYIPAVKSDNTDAEKINVFLQGGSFTWDFKHYLQANKICRRFHMFYYNTWQGAGNLDPLANGEKAWDKIIRNTDYVILECNEQYVVQMGTNQPSWGAEDKKKLDYNANDIYVALYNYLKNTEATWEAED